MSRNVFLTSQTASLKSNKAIAISGNRYMSNNSSNISQYKTAKTLVSVCKDTKISDIHKCISLYFKQFQIKTSILFKYHKFL